MSLIIRKATIEDANELFELNELFNGTEITTKELLAESLKNNTQEIVFIAIMNNKAVGFTCGHIYRSMCYDTYNGEITELFVKIEYRRKGIGSQLITEIQNEFNKNDVFCYQLFTGTTNTNAQAFYTSHGYNRLK